MPGSEVCQPKRPPCMHAHMHQRRLLTLTILASFPFPGPSPCAHHCSANGHPYCAREARLDAEIDVLETSEAQMIPVGQQTQQHVVAGDDNAMQCCRVFPSIGREAKLLTR